MDDNATGAETWSGAASGRSSGPLGTLRANFGQKPLLLGTIYVLTSLIFTGSLGMAGQWEDSVALHMAIYSHITLPVLVVGMAIFSQRLVFLPAATFIVCFVLVELLSLEWTQKAGWSALDMANALLISAVSGTGGGFLAHAFLRAHEAGHPMATPERAALLGGATTALASGVLGGLALWYDVHGLSGREDVWTMLLVLWQRCIQLGLIGVAGILLFLDLPTRRALPEVVVLVLAFGVLGWLDYAGLSVIPAMDAPLLALLIFITRPIQRALAGVLGGLTLYILLTGHYVDLPTILTEEDMRQDLLTNLLFGLLAVIAIHRAHQTRMDRIRQQTLGRMTRAQELARFGYFLYDDLLHVVWLDPLAQRILNMPPSAREDEFLLRIHPEDRDAVSNGATSPTEGGRSFSFRFSLDGLWQPECFQRHFTGFARFEQGSSGQILTYGIVVDVTQEHVQEEQLRLVLAELSDRQGQQTQLFSMISHELRTPAAILSMLADELDDGRSWQDTGPQMRAVLDQLLAILRDMRQTVRPEQNLPIHIETFTPYDLAQSICDAFRTMAQARGIEILLTMGAGADQLRSTDKVRLNQTLSNLVKNAILHSQATEVCLRYQEEPGHLGVWTVSDNGRNIPQAQREKLFHPFARSVDSAARVDGSGLGLYIAKGAIELLGGSIEYVEKPMSGAEFRVALPMKPPESEQPTVDAPLRPAVDLSGLTVLVVEDSETMGGLLVARLSKAFADVKWLRDGASGLAWAGLNAPDVVISDLFMPGLGGDEMVRRLRQRGFDKPIIGMTATDIGEEVDKFRKSGADAVITKPLRLQDLETALARLL